MIKIALLTLVASAAIIAAAATVTESARVGCSYNISQHPELANVTCGCDMTQDRACLGILEDE